MAGAPLAGGSEFTTPDFMKKNDDGQLVIPAKARVRLASYEDDGGDWSLRRGHSFTDGIDPIRGRSSGFCSSLS